MTLLEILKQLILSLIFSDVEILERRIAKTTRGARNDKILAKELDFQQRMKKFLEDGNLAIKFETEDEDEHAWLQEYNLINSISLLFLQLMFQKMI